MKLFTLYLLLFAFGCYSIFSAQFLAIENVADGDQMECALETSDLACCQANLTVSGEETSTHEEEKNSSKKSC
jgi:hypothetical protein